MFEAWQYGLTLLAVFAAFGFTEFVAWYVDRRKKAEGFVIRD